MECLFNIGILFCVYAMLALSLNMVAGLSGIVLYAHAAFYGIGAYAVAILMMSYGFNFWMATFTGVLLTGMSAFLISQIINKFKNNYNTVVLLCLSVIAFFVLVDFKGLTRWCVSVNGVGRFYSAGLFFTFVFAFTIFFYGLFALINRSSFGRALKGLREDEKLICFLGYKTKQYKSAVYTLSAMVAGVAGSFFASYNIFVNPTSFQLYEGIFLLTLISVGAFSSIYGRIIVATILLLLPEGCRFIGLPYETAMYVQQLIYGMLLVMTVLFRSQNLFGKYRT